MSELGRFSRELPRDDGEAFFSDARSAFMGELPASVEPMRISIDGERARVFGAGAPLIDGSSIALPL